MYLLSNNLLYATMESLTFLFYISKNMVVSVYYYFILVWYICHSWQANKTDTSLLMKEIVFVRTHSVAQLCKFRDRGVMYSL